MLVTPLPPWDRKWHFFVLSDRKSKFLQIQATQCRETSTQLGLQVNACGKPLFQGEKCRLERLFILIWRWLMIFWRWDWSEWTTNFCLNTDLSSSRNSKISFWTAKNYFDATSGAQDIRKHEWDWYKWLQYHMGSDKKLFIKKLINWSKHLGGLESQWKVTSIKIYSFLSITVYTEPVG